MLEIGGLAAFMLWASQRTWVEHYVTLVLTLSAVGMIASDASEADPARRRARWALGLAAGGPAHHRRTGLKIWGPGPG